ncbi:KaiA family protein [Anabaena sphaerica FACHB-251]|uniref:Circadian clock oscillator protein KaiA n=1 Tax=Anabaena sphaerica FACHB-251 TaxID=2692883 RepID=A0A926WCW7_9NOST|nr:KaiA family protein [Anabaena sphaerica]MBD2291917.1 KaiA family protein [Anabaena sphaerica FACHB-251]
MILPILLIWLPDVKKYLYNPETVNKQQGFIGQLRNFIDEIFYQLFTLPLTVSTPTKIQYLHNKRQVSTYQLLKHYDQYVLVLACNEQKNQQCFQEMSPAEKQEILNDLKADYRKILLNYFITEKTLKTTIDKFINALFYANIPVPQIIEIHMELIDEFSKQLKLEGRSDETLLDYRLTLIDILANLCEVYRCSISKIN